MAKRKTKDRPPKQKPVHVLSLVCALMGVLVLMLGITFLGQEISSLIWRLKLKYWYVEGRARIEQTAVARREGVYELDLTYRLEIAGQKFQSTFRQEADESWYSTVEEAEKGRARYVVGELYPCWYRADDPQSYHELLPAGLRLSMPLKRFWIPIFVLGVGIGLCWPVWSRRNEFSDPED